VLPSPQSILGGEFAAVALLSASVNVTTVTLEAARPWVTFTLTPTPRVASRRLGAVLVAPAVAVPGALSTPSLHHVGTCLGVVCEPLTAKVPPEPVTVPVELLPSPRRWWRWNSAAVALALASVNVATVTLAARPWVAFTFTPVAESGDGAT